MAADQDKIQAMVDWLTPIRVKDLRGFLGLTGYYRRFILSYAIIASPLTGLLKKDVFQWCQEAEEAFINLKLGMTRAPVLALPDFQNSFVVETDASGTGVGAVLMQEGRPIAYFSKAFTNKAKLKGAYERELIAIMLAVSKWWHYLLGHKFIIKTDQYSLKYLLEQKEVPETYQKWVIKLMGYTFDIQYKAGKANIAADALSRHLALLQIHINTWFAQNAVDLEAIRSAVEQDPELAKTKQEVLDQPESRPRYLVRGDNLLYKGRLAIPAHSSLTTKFLRLFHESPIGGHSGFLKTYQRLKQQLYWKGMKGDVKRYVSVCQVC